MGAQEANSLFEVLTANPPTAAEQDDVRRIHNYISWLGDFYVTNPVERTFYVPSLGVRHGETLSQDTAIEVVSAHLGRYSNTLGVTNYGVEATNVLQRYIERYLDRGIVDHGTVWERVPGDGYYIGQFVLYDMQDGIRVVETPERQRSSLIKPVMNFTRENGDLVFIRPDSQQRHIVSRDSGRIVVHSQTLHSLRTEDPKYFRDLNIHLGKYRQSLWRLAINTGIDPSTMVDKKTKRPNYAAMEEVSEQVQEQKDNGSIPEATLEQLGNLATIIWESIRTKRYLNPETNRGEESGLSATAHRVRSYFESLVRQTPSESN